MKFEFKNEEELIEFAEENTFFVYDWPEEMKNAEFSIDGIPFKFEIDKSEDGRVLSEDLVVDNRFEMRLWDLDRSEDSWYPSDESIIAFIMDAHKALKVNG